MLSMYNSKTVTLAVVFVFLSVYFVSPVNGYSLKYENGLSTIDYENKTFSNCSVTRNYDIEVKDVRGGFGLKISFKNEGDENVENIKIISEIKGGLIVFPKTKNYEISVLHSGETKKLKIRMFGFGLGKLLQPPTVNIWIEEDKIKVLYAKIIVSILGNIVRVLDVYLKNEYSYEGYTLFAPEYSTNTYLIKNDGEIVKKWASNNIQALGVYLLENGNLIRTCLPWLNTVFTEGGVTGRVEIFNWNGTRIWKFDYSNSQHCIHHDIEVLPNGNILMIAWEYKSFSEAVEAGKNPFDLTENELWPDTIIEVKPTGKSGGNIVWEWRMWDHLIQDYDSTKNNYGNVSEHPELIDINFGNAKKADMAHINSVDYNEELDQILLSVRNYDEIWVIDHSTTTEEAAGHTGGRYGRGGDLLYRWGNPATYKAGDKEDQKFFEQHDARWIDENCPGGGNILVFNNGIGRPDGLYSSIVEIVPPLDKNGNYTFTPGRAFGPEEPIWVYEAENPTDFFADHLSSAQRLPNGNTLICDGPAGYFFEVTPNKEIVWQYLNKFLDPLHRDVFMVHRYPPDYPGLKNIS